jgi:hypothetical protein
MGELVEVAVGWFRATHSPSHNQRHAAVDLGGALAHGGVVEGGLDVEEKRPPI